MAGLDTKLALSLQKAYQLHLFIETGTYKGQAAYWACQHFSRVITIEGLKSRYEKTLADYTAHHAEICANIRFVYGDSGMVLPDILADIHEPALFWLDSHWCGTDDDQRKEEGLSVNPVLAELAAINAHEYARSHIVLIDDLRLFGVERGWPSLDAVKRELGAVLRGIMAIGDILCAVPEEESIVYAKQ